MLQRILWKIETNSLARVINISGRSQKSDCSKSVMLKTIVLLIEAANQYEGSPFFSDRTVNECGSNEILVETSIVFLDIQQMQNFLSSMEKIMQS